ncbi:MAG: hypothetical protein N3B01_09030 [Verrucomicrobiae bacterium]|nr:hypothetical protein [Verrucomicrobiae bacterium]
MTAEAAITTQLQITQPGDRTACILSAHKLSVNGVQPIRAPLVAVRGKPSHRAQTTPTSPVANTVCIR